MPSIRQSRRRFLSNGLAVSGALALGSASRTGFAAMQTAAPATASAKAQDITGKNSLKAHAARKKLLVGAAVEAQLLASDPAIAKIVTDQFSLLVAENSMKVGPMRPTPTTYSFDAGDALVAFGDAHGIKVRGHNLCWHAQLPSWFNSYVTKENAKQVLTDHISTVAGHFKGKLQSWDVVNEAIQVSDGQPGGLRNGPWYKMLGADFIPIAFQTARAADPNVLLTYNDYGIETDSDGDTKKRAAILELVRGMQANKVPIDAVGIQSHIHTSWTPDNAKGFREWMATLRGMGLKLFATELDVNDDTMNTEDPAEIDAAVAKVYHDYIDMLMNEPAVTAVVTWGITDAHTWLAGRRPGGPRPPGIRPPGQGGQPGAPAGATATQPPAQAQVQPPPPPGQAEVLPPGPPPGQAALHRAPERPLLFGADNNPKSAFFMMRDSIDRRKA
jgi:endo-1,4-beta-xylanase